MRTSFVIVFAEHYEATTLTLLLTVLASEQDREKKINRSVLAAAVEKAVLSSPEARPFVAFRTREWATIL